MPIVTIINIHHPGFARCCKSAMKYICDTLGVGRASAGPVPISTRPQHHKDVSSKHSWEGSWGVFKTWQREGRSVPGGGRLIPKLGDPTHFSLALYLLKHRHRTKKSHWHDSSITRDKGGSHSCATVPLGAKEFRSGLSVSLYVFVYHINNVSFLQGTQEFVLEFVLTISLWNGEAALLV